MYNFPKGDLDEESKVVMDTKEIGKPPKQETREAAVEKWFKLKERM